MPDRPPLRVVLAVGVVAGCTLALQVLLTRLFAAVLFYHFAFLAISLALLGTGAGALAIYVRPRWFERTTIEAQLAGWGAALAVLLFVVPGLLVRLHYTLSTAVTMSFTITLAAACALSALPFLAAGVVVALAIRHYIGSVSRVYAFDLVGAGVGAVAVVPVLWLVDAPTLIVVLGVLAAAAASALAGLHRGVGRFAFGLAAVGALLVVLAGATSLYYLPPLRFGPGALKPTADRWTPLSRVVGYRPGGSSFAEITYDRDAAPVPVYRRGQPYPDWRSLQLGPQSVGYALTGPGRALVIGGGGGRDIFNALSSGQRRVDVIELNRMIRDIVDRDLRRWSGAPYTLPRVHTAIGDGRSTLAARGTRYDQIHIGFTNTLSASSGSSFALAENNLYTVEAFNEYFDHLRPNGVLNVSRLYRLAGEEALRATVLTLQTLSTRGVRHPERNVVVLLGNSGTGVLAGTVLSRLRPFTPAELGLVRRLAAQRGNGVAYAPGGPYQLEWRELARAHSVRDFCTRYRIDVCAPTDDKPFFLQVTRLRNLGASRGNYTFSPNPFVVLLVALGVLSALSLLAFVLPLAAHRPSQRPTWTSLLFFAAIGLGFLVLELVLIQRFVLFLGFPTYALSVVLFSMLIFAGLGARLSSWWYDPRRALGRALAAAVVLVAASAYGLQPLLRALIDLPFAARVGISVALLAPVGVALGTAMPIGLRRLSGLYPAGVAWAWGINGITSVLASVLGVFVAITCGFALATVLAAACYAWALAHAVLGRWPASPAAHDPRGAAASQPETTSGSD